jgi:glutamate carboxypeptidase
MKDIRARLPEMLVLLKQLVETESASHDKAGVDRVGAIVKQEVLRLGAQVRIHPNQAVGDLIEANFLSDRKEKGILLLAHMDTVFPAGTLEHMPYHEQEDRIYGPGTSDMKGGIVVGLAAVASALENGSLHRPVTALFTSDEELGSESSRTLIEELAMSSALVLVLEPGMVDGSVKVWRKGVGDFKVTIHGKAAHAGGDHEKGRNAIEEAAHQVLAIQKMTDYAKGTTLNVGRINGGTANNVVPGLAEVYVDLRVMQPGEAERITSALKVLRPVLDGTTIEVSGELNRPPMPFDERMKQTFEKVKAIAAGNGIKITSSGTGGASDGNFVAPLGIPVLDGLGPAGDGAHSEREYIYKESLVERAKLVEAILREW